MSQWVVCKYPEVHGSEVAEVKVPTHVCLACERTFCNAKIKLLKASFPPDVTEIPEKGRRVAKSGYCPLRTHALSWCNASAHYCKYNRVCELADKYPKRTLVIHIAEANMFIVKEKKQEGPMSTFTTLDEAIRKVDIKKVKVVYQVTNKLIAHMEFVPKSRDGSAPKTKAIRGVDNYVLIGEDGVRHEYKDILEGKVSELYIADREYVPALTLEKVPVDPINRAAAPARRKR